MKEQFVSYTIAKELKELGFDGEGIAEYVNGIFIPHCQEIETSFDPIEDVEFDVYTNKDPNWIERDSREVISAPLWQQAIDWLFSEKRIYISIDITIRSSTNKGRFYYQLDSDNGYRIYIDKDRIEFSTYQEAREQAILKAIEKLKTKNE